MYCVKLENLTIPNSVTTIGRDAFLGCLSVKVQLMSGEHVVI